MSRPEKREIFKKFAISGFIIIFSLLTHLDTPEAFAKNRAQAVKAQQKQNKVQVIQEVKKRRPVWNWILVQARLKMRSHYMDMRSIRVAYYKVARQNREFNQLLREYRALQNEFPQKDNKVVIENPNIDRRLIFQAYRNVYREVVILRKLIRSRNFKEILDHLKVEIPEVDLAIKNLNEAGLVFETNIKNLKEAIRVLREKKDVSNVVRKDALSRDWNLNRLKAESLEPQYFIKSPLNFIIRSIVPDGDKVFKVDGFLIFNGEYKPVTYWVKKNKDGSFDIFQIYHNKEAQEDFYVIERSNDQQEVITHERNIIFRGGYTSINSQTRVFYDQKKRRIKEKGQRKEVTFCSVGTDGCPKNEILESTWALDFNVKTNLPVNYKEAFEFKKLHGSIPEDPNAPILERYHGTVEIKFDAKGLVKFFRRLTRWVIIAPEERILDGKHITSKSSQEIREYYPDSVQLRKSALITERDFFIPIEDGIVQLGHLLEQHNVYHSADGRYTTNHDKTRQTLYYPGVNQVHEVLEVDRYEDFDGDNHLSTFINSAKTIFNENGTLQQQEYIWLTEGVSKERRLINYSYNDHDQSLLYVTEEQRRYVFDANGNEVLASALAGVFGSDMSQILDVQYTVVDGVIVHTHVFDMDGNEIESLGGEGWIDPELIAQTLIMRIKESVARESRTTRTEQLNPPLRTEILESFDIIEIKSGENGRLIFTDKNSFSEIELYANLEYLMSEEILPLNPREDACDCDVIDRIDFMTEEEIFLFIQNYVINYANPNPDFIHTPATMRLRQWGWLDRVTGSLAIAPDTGLGPVWSIRMDHFTGHVSERNTIFVEKFLELKQRVADRFNAPVENISTYRTLNITGGDGHPEIFFDVSDGNSNIVRLGYSYIGEFHAPGLPEQLNEEFLLFSIELLNENISPQNRMAAFNAHIFFQDIFNQRAERVNDYGDVHEENLENIRDPGYLDYEIDASTGHLLFHLNLGDGNRATFEINLQTGEIAFVGSDLESDSLRVLKEKIANESWHIDQGNVDDIEIVRIERDENDRLIVTARTSQYEFEFYGNMSFLFDPNEFYLDTHDPACDCHPTKLINLSTGNDLAQIAFDRMIEVLNPRPEDEITLGHITGTWGDKQPLFHFLVNGVDIGFGHDSTLWDYFQVNRFTEEVSTIYGLDTILEIREEVSLGYNVNFEDVHAIGGVGGDFSWTIWTEVANNIQFVYEYVDDDFGGAIEINDSTIITSIQFSTNAGSRRNAVRDAANLFKEIYGELPASINDYGEFEDIIDFTDYGVLGYQMDENTGHLLLDFQKNNGNAARFEVNLETGAVSFVGEIILREAQNNQDRREDNNLLNVLDRLVVKQDVKARNKELNEKLVPMINLEGEKALNNLVLKK